MTVNAEVLQQERTRLQNEVNNLTNQISTMNGEIKAHLSALGITEADVEKSTTDAKTALAAAENEFNNLYAAYEQYKAQVATPAQAPIIKPTAQA